MAPYAELQALSAFTFREGASHPDELVLTARALGLAALAITDRNTVAGLVRAHLAAKAHGLRFLPAARLDLDGRIVLPLLPLGPRRLEPALPPALLGQAARAEGGVPDRARGSRRPCRGPGAGRPPPAVSRPARCGLRRAPSLRCRSIAGTNRSAAHARRRGRAARR
ncbi:MAG: hypothetical protein RML45_07025 [Acetobacteraceae bacterium]|nr:hypothetical protein [Acetobacteraceae bacterium]